MIYGTCPPPRCWSRAAGPSFGAALLLSLSLSLSLCVYIYIYIYTHIVYIYIYIYRERDKERESEIMCISCNMYRLCVQTIVQIQARPLGEVAGAPARRRGAGHSAPQVGREQTSKTTNTRVTYIYISLSLYI